MYTNYKIDRIVDESATIKSFYLKPDNGLAIPYFIPGQFVNVKLNSVGENEFIRSYTLSDSPNKDYLRLTIKQEPKGKSSSYFHNMSAVGDVISLSKPMGNFNLNTQSCSPVVLLSAGVGITPMISFVEYILENQPNREVHFLHSSRNDNVQPMLNRLKQIKTSCSNFRLTIFHSLPLDHEILDKHYHYKGRISKSFLSKLNKEVNYYICGPMEYIESITGFLKDLGVPKNQQFFEYFNKKLKGRSNIELDENTNKGYKITLLKSKKEMTWYQSKTTLLEICESIGLTPSNSCRMGTCSTCETKIIKGAVKYDPEPFMDVSEGNVLICCAIPTSDIEIEL
tara:strand:- start:1715 stop:2734 length:1020 start_codon:yes stop_codon:yes gene_type:complete